MAAEIIVALDVDTEQQGLHLLDHCNPQYCAIKIGSALFTRLGPQIVKEAMRRQFRVFLDLKFHDIPTTVAHSVAAAADLGVWMLTLHASGGEAMLGAAKEAVKPYGVKAPLLVAVTILTSQAATAEQVLALASVAQEVGLAGVVCAGWEVPALKALCGRQFLAVTPGIRLSSDPCHDQKRVLTPVEAQQKGSDYIVIGRSITLASHPGQVLERIYQELQYD